jgi:RecB family endonuclease NucS
MANTITYEQLLDLFKETDAQIKELAASDFKTRKILDELAEERKKTELLQQENSKQIKEISKQIGGLNNSIGEYTENFLKQSIETLLKESFDVEVVTHDLKAKKTDKNMQIDAIGYSNSNRNELYLVELKTKLRAQDITQLDKIVKNVFTFLPEHKNKKVFGVLIAVNFDEKLAKQITDKGYYFAHISGGLLVLDQPSNFKVKVTTYSEK